MMKLNLESTCDSEGSYDDGDIEMFAEKEDDELFTAVEEGLITPSLGYRGCFCHISAFSGGEYRRCIYS